MRSKITIKPSLKMHKILAIEDSDLFRQSLKIWIEVNGMQAIDSPNIQWGLQLAKQEKPDLIVCDIRMLGLDSHKSLKALRQDPVTTKIPLILLTSTDNERHRAMELGADDCLSRFCIFEQLIRAIKTQIKKKTRINCSVNVQKFMNKSILVIEHNEAMRSALCRLLYSENFKVMSAQDGCLGFLLAKEFQPNLILCGINLPKLDGYKLLNRLRENLLTAEIPFIFISPNLDPFNFLHTLKLGANDCLAKPVDKRELLEAIANQLELCLSS